MKGFDIFQKANTDAVSNSSKIGGFFSLFTLIISVLLLYNEYKEYVREDFKTEFLVKQNDEEEIQVNLDVLILNQPCALIGIDIQDDMGSHILNYTDNLRKVNVDKEQKYISEYRDDKKDNYLDTNPEFDDVVKQIKAKQGCQLKGFLIVKRVPGNFHIANHHRSELIRKLMMKEQSLFQQLNSDYKIKHLSFGKSVDEKGSSGMNRAAFQNLFGSYKNKSLLIAQGINIDSLNPYDNTSNINTGKNNYNNFLKVIPVDFNIFQGAFWFGSKYKMSLSQMNMYQNTVNISLDELSIIYFHFEFSPIHVQYRKIAKSRYHFIVGILAIIGGIYSVTGMVNAMTQNVYQKVKKRQ